MKVVLLRLLTVGICTLGVFALFPCSPSPLAAEKNYDELRREFQEYTAPSYYRSVTAPRERPEAQEDEGEKLLRAKIEELLAVKARWEELVGKYPREGQFFEPSERAVEEIREIVNSEAIQDRLAGDIHLDIVLATAVLRNRRLKMAKSELEAALERYSQVTNLDEIMRQYASFVEGLMTKVGPQRHREMIQMRFPFPGMLSLKGDIVNKEAEIARERYEIELRDLVTNVKHLYYEIVFTDKAIDITERSFNILEQLERVATSLYTTGKTSYTDVIKLQIRIAKLNDNLEKLRDKKATLTVKLNALLDLPSGFQPGPMQEPELHELAFDREQLIQLGPEARQEIRALELTIEKMALLIEMAERKIYPDFTLGYSYFQNVEQMQVGTQGPQESFSTRPMIQAKSWFGHMDAYIREARLKLTAVKEQLEEAINTLGADVKETLFKYANAQRLRKLYRDELLDQAKESLDLAVVGYQTGALTFPDVAEAEVVWLRFNLEYQRSIADQNQHFAALERIVGRGLADVE